MSFTIWADRPDGGQVPFQPESCIKYPIADDGNRVLEVYHRPSDALWFRWERFWTPTFPHYKPMRSGDIFLGPARHILVGGECRLISKCEASAIFREAGRPIPAELAGKSADNPATPTQCDSESQILSTLRRVGHRLTTRKLLGEMTKLGLNPAESTVKKRLAEMVKVERLTKDPKAKPPGYGVPE